LLKYDPKTNSFKLKFDIADENDSYIDVIKSKELRAYKQLEHSRIELENFKGFTVY
jgi:hypothetical protein